MMPAPAPKILIVDPVGLLPGPDGTPDISAFVAHVTARGCAFHHGPDPAPDTDPNTAPGALPGQPPAPLAHFHYCPDLATPAQILPLTDAGQFDAVIAAATPLPPGARFPLGGVRVGSGTGNMTSESWGGPDGTGGTAPLMNTPGINARATAQMVMKALLRRRPDLPVLALHDRVAAGDFDTGRDLAAYPTAKLEGRCMAILGYGNIGRQVALLARAFGMRVQIYARPRHRLWIESEGFTFAPTPEAAAKGADVLSIHLGFGPMGPHGPANAGLVGAGVLAALAPGAMLINFDRGELVDVPALAQAMETGHLAHAAIDADLFRDASTGALSGPMRPYLDLLPRFNDRLELLPHAAADTDHPSRVAGAIQAADQILAAVLDRRVHNLKGDLPPGYRNGGAIRPPGLGAPDGAALAQLANDPGALDDLREATQRLSRALTAITPAPTGTTRPDVTPEQGQDLMLAANLLRRLLAQNGLEGPFTG